MKTELLISALVVSLTACAVDPIDGTDSDDVATGVDGEIRRLAANGITPASVASSGITAAQLTQTVVNNLSTTKDKAAVLMYLVQCAMPSTYSISSTSGLPYTYTGQFGLAPTWSSGALSQASQRAISSCVFARMNAYGRNVTISMRGAGLGLDPGEADSHIYPEGVFYGNLFPGADNFWGACDADGPTHVDRQCAQPGQCSMTNPGLSSCAATCSYDAAGTATSCIANGNKVYANPVSVYLDAVSP